MFQGRQVSGHEIRQGKSFERLPPCLLSEFVALVIVLN